MKHVAIVIAGLAWGAIALAIYACLGLDTGGLAQVAPSTFGCAIATAYVLTWIFGAALRSPRARRNRALPFLTIAAGVGLWTILSFVVAAISSLVLGRPDVFDGFFYALPVVVVAMLTVALPLSYPLAYATQRWLGHALDSCSPKNADIARS